MRRLSSFEAALALGAIAAFAIGLIVFVFVPAYEQMAKDRAATLALLTKLAQRPAVEPAAGAPPTSPVRPPEAEKPAEPAASPPSSRVSGSPHERVRRKRVPFLLPEIDCANPDDPLCEKL